MCWHVSKYHPKEFSGLKQLKGQCNLDPRLQKNLSSMLRGESHAPGRLGIVTSKSIVLVPRFDIKSAILVACRLHEHAMKTP